RTRGSRARRRGRGRSPGGARLPQALIHPEQPGRLDLPVIPLMGSSLTARPKVGHRVGWQGDHPGERFTEKLRACRITNRTEWPIRVVDDDRAALGEITADDGRPDRDALEQLVG